MKALIVDDEKLALELLDEYLKDLGVETYRAVDAQEALELYKNHARHTPIPVVFLDINMPGINGIELARQIREINSRAFIVFQTAYREYSLDAFDVGSIGYLLKPYSKEEVRAIIERVRKLATMPKFDELILTAKLGNRSYILKPGDIFYIKADLDDLIVRIEDKSLFLQRRMKDMEEKLSDYGFFRVHRSYLINLNRIKDLRTIEQSRFEITFRGIGESVTASKEGSKLLRMFLDSKEG